MGTWPAETIRIRILAADDTNRPPVAGADVALTNLDTAVQVVADGQRLRSGR